MLIAVVGSRGLNEVIGLESQDKSALMRAVPSDSTAPVIVLAPRHLSRLAREQAHILVAADQRARVCVLPLDHHALTLTLIAAAVLADKTWRTARADAGGAVQLILQAAERSRSLVWYPHVWGLTEPEPTLLQLLTSVVVPAGFFSEVGVGAGLVRSRAASLLTPHQVVYLPTAPPAVLADQLVGATIVSVPVTVDKARPYATKSCVELAVLGSPSHAPWAAPRCTSCTASLVAGSCVFCGHGPWTRSGPQLSAVGGTGR